MPKISIIIPAYNAEKSIKRCLNSIIDQEMQDYEIIVVNDGSKDNTENEVLSFKDRLGEKLKYYYKENAGVSSARNYGIANAIGDYILFIDSDDYISKDLLKSQYENMCNNIDVIKFKMVMLDKDQNVLKKIDGPVFQSTDGQDAFNRLFYQDVLIDQLCIYLIRKDYWDNSGYKFIDGTYHEDFGIIPIMLVNAKSVISTDVYGYNYVQTDNSIMRNNNRDKTLKKMNDSFMHYDNMLKFIKIAQISDFTKENLKIYYTNSILLKIEELCDEDKKIYIKEFKKRKMYKNIKIRNVKQMIKRILLKINVNLYYKIR